MSQGT